MSYDPENPPDISEEEREEMLRRLAKLGSALSDIAEPIRAISEFTCIPGRICGGGEMMAQKQAEIDGLKKKIAKMHYALRCIECEFNNESWQSKKIQEAIDCALDRRDT